MAEHRNFTPLSDEEFLTYDKDAQKNPVFTPISDEEFITGRPSGAQDVVRYFGGSAEEESGGSWLTDPLVALGKGTVSLGTQIGDLAMLGASQVGNLFIQDDRDKLDLNADARASGYFTPEQWNESLHSMYSKETQEAIANIENAEGAWGKVGAIVSNPRGALAYVTESIPGMVPVFKGASIAGKAAAASAAAKQLVGKEAEKYISRRAAAGSFGAESGVTGLALSQQIGQENLANGREYGENQWYAIPGALASAAISLVNPMEARIMTRNLVTRAALREGKNVNLLERKGLKGMAARLGWDMAKEGLAEEGVQNVIEGVATNLAGGRPWHEDMGENYVEGALIGGMMGGMMHPLTGGRRGSVEDAINNQGEPPADQTAQPQQAIDPNKVGAATPGQTMTPANQTQVAQAVSQVPDPNQAAQTSPAQAVATAPGAPLTTEEKWNAQKKKLDEENRLKAEEAARIDQEERAKYGEDFLARHADTFHKQTKGLSEDEKTFVFNTYEAQGILGNVNAPSRNRVDEALRAYKYSNGDKAKAAERFRGWAREAENSGAKNAVETADYYDAMADILEGQDAKKSLEFKRQQREQAIQQAKEAQAKAEAQAQAQQTQQTQEGKTEAVKKPAEKPQATESPETAARIKALSEQKEVPTAEELKGLKKEDVHKVYNNTIDRLLKEGKITEDEAKEKRRRPPSDNSKNQGAFNSLHKLSQREVWTSDHTVRATRFQRKLSSLSKTGAANIMGTELDRLNKIISTGNARELNKFIEEKTDKIEALVRLENAKSHEDISEGKIALWETLKKQGNYAQLNKELKEAGVSDSAESGLSETGLTGDEEKTIETIDENSDTEENYALLEKARKKLDPLLASEYGSYEPNQKTGKYTPDKVYVRKKGALTAAEEEVLAKFGDDKDREKLQQLYLKDQNVENGKLDKTTNAKGEGGKIIEDAEAEEKNRKKESKKEREERREAKPITEEDIKKDQEKAAKLEEAKKKGDANKEKFLRSTWNNLSDGEKVHVAQELGLEHENLPKVPKEDTEKSRKILDSLSKDEEKKELYKRIASEELDKTPSQERERSEAWPSGRLSHAGQVQASAAARDKNLSEVVKIIADNKLLFKGDELSIRKASRGEQLTESQKDKKQKEIKANLYDTWGYETTNQLLDSGKVVICASDEEFVNTVIADEMAAEPGLTEEKIRQELKEEDLLNGVEGLYDPHSKKVYLVAQNIKKNDAGAVLAHELAVHAVKDDPGFKELVEDLEGRIATLMVDGLKSKNPSERAFWMQIKKRLKDAGLLSEENQALDGRELLRQLDSFGKEELLAYFMTEYARKNGIPPQGRLQEMLQFFGKLRDHLMSFLGVNRLSKKGVADLLTNAARVIAEESAQAKANTNEQTSETTKTEAQTVHKLSRAFPVTPRDWYYTPDKLGDYQNADLLYFDPSILKGKLNRTALVEAQKRGFKGFRRGPIRLPEGNIYDRGSERMLSDLWDGKDPSQTHLTGKGMVHAVDNAQIDPERLPPEYVKGELDENIVQQVVRGLSKPVDIYYQPSAKGEGKFTFVSDDLLVSTFWNPKLECYDIVTRFKPSKATPSGIKLTAEKAALLSPISSAEMKSPKKQQSSEEEGSSHEEDRTAGNETSASDSSLGQGSVNYEKMNSTQIEEAVKRRRNQLVEEATDIFLSQGGQLPEKESSSSASIRKASRAEKSSSDQTKKSKGSTKTDTEKELKKLEKQLEAERKQQEAQAEINQMEGAESIETESILEKGFATALNEKVESLPDGAFRKTIGRPAVVIARYLEEFAKYVNVTFLKFTDDLVRQVEKNIPSARDWYQGVIDCAKLVNDIRNKGLAIGEMFFVLPEDKRTEVNKFLYDSVMGDKWGYKPTNWKNAAGKIIPPEAFTTSEDMVARFNALTDKQKAVIKEVHKWCHDKQLEKQKLIDTIGRAIQGENYKSKFEEPKNYLPYVPLERTGRYNVVWKSKALTDAEAKYNRLKKARDEWEALNQKEKVKAEEQKTEFKKLDFPDENAFEELERQIDSMRRDGNHYHVARFDALWKAQKRVNELNSQHGGNQAQLYNIGNKEHMKSLTGMKDLEQLGSNLKSSLDETFYGKASDGLKNVIDEYLYDAAYKRVDNSTRERLKVAGANENIMDSFLNRVNSDAHLIANMTYGKTISDAYVRMREELKAFKGKHGSAPYVNSLNTAFNELEKRHLQMMERKPHTNWDTASELLRSGNTIFSLSLKPMFYVQNALQPWMMTAPMLAGRFGASAAHNTLLGAYRDYGSIFTRVMKKAKGAKGMYRTFGNLTKGIEDSNLDAGEKAMLSLMEKRNLLDLGAQQEFGSFTGDTALSKAANKVMTEIGVAARGVEILNRFTVALAGYRLQKAKLIKNGMTEAQAHAAATEYAAELLSATQGDYSAQNAPSAFNTRLGKVALQFRKFQAIQFNFFVNMMKGSIENMNPDEKKVARQSLKYAMAAHFAMAGFKGLPAVTAIAALTGGLFGDDDEEPEDWFRRKCTEASIPKRLVDLILEGIPSMLGLNLSDSVGAGIMASITPYTRKDFNKEGGMTEFLINVAGAPLGRLLRMHTGWTQSNMETNGMRPFIEAALPAGIPGIFKAAGILDATVDKRTGAKFLSDEDFGLTDRLLLTMGVMPKVLEDMYRMRGQVRRTQEWGTQQSGEIKARFINTRRGNNWKEINEIYRDLEEISVKRREKGLPKIKRSDLHSAYKQRVKEEKSMQQYGGMKVPQSQRRLAERIYNMNH